MPAVPYGGGVDGRIVEKEGMSGKRGRKRDRVPQTGKDRPSPVFFQLSFIRAGGRKDDQPLYVPHTVHFVNFVPYLFFVVFHLWFLSEPHETFFHTFWKHVLQ